MDEKKLSVFVMADENVRRGLIGASPPRVEVTIA